MVAYDTVYGSYFMLFHEFILICFNWVKVGFSGQSHPRNIKNSPDKGLQNEETDIRGSGGGVDSDMQPDCKAMDLCNLCIEYTVTSAFDSGLAGLVSALVGDGGTFCTRNISWCWVSKWQSHAKTITCICWFACCFTYFHVHGQAHITPSS